MHNYVILCLCGRDVVASFDVEADSDQEALALLALHGEKADCVLWDGEKLLATVMRGYEPLWVAQCIAPMCASRGEGRAANDA